MDDMYYELESGGRRMCFNKNLHPCVRDVKKFQFKPDDVMVSSYPKTGSMWVTEMVWQMLHPDETSSEILTARAPILELGALPDLGFKLSGMQMLEDMPCPRLIKTHLMPEFFCDDWLESGAKRVVVTRNPKDTLVSYFNFRQKTTVSGFDGSWDDFYRMFKEKKYLLGDYFDFYESWWKYHSHPNVMFISYEELKEDPEKGVHRLGHFLKGGISDSLVRRIVEATSMKVMKEDKQLNEAVAKVSKPGALQFVRKGIVGDWKNYFTPEQNEYVEKLYRERLESQGLILKFQN